MNPHAVTTLILPKLNVIKLTLAEREEILRFPFLKFRQRGGAATLPT
jgi:hypothetical protein